VTRVHLLGVTIAVLLSGAFASARAQSPEFVPEIDTHVTLNSYMRTYLVTKDDRDAGATSQFSVGPSLQFYFKPLLRMKRITAFDLDNAKSRPVVIEDGYRYLISPGEPSTQRMQPMVTSHFPLKDGFLASDRNRADLDWKSGVFSWRYRNKLTIERAVRIDRYHFIPYVAAEPYYTSQYSKWSTTDLYVGGLFPVGKHVQFNCYYDHENNTGKSPNQPKNYIDVAMQLYFSAKKK
jgi:hypothetical protein